MIKMTGDKSFRKNGKKNTTGQENSFPGKENPFGGKPEHTPVSVAK
jgi:hypothetical protein